MRKRKIFKRLETIILKTKNTIDFMAVVGVFYILLFQVRALRVLCKTVCQYVTAWYIPVELSFFKNLYLWLESIFRIIFLLAILFHVIFFVVRTIWDRRLRRKTGGSRFEESIFRYLQDTAVSRCFLVTGKWGSGKTYEVNRFFDKYYRYSKTEVYRISCFGLSSRKDLIEEINQTIEQKDASFYARMIRVLQFLPVIGAAIEKFLKKSYTYTSIKKGSIFIFDDFERITSRIVEGGNVEHIYHKNPRSFARGTNTSEFSDIEKEFQAVERSFLKIEGFIDQNAVGRDYDKYIAATGLINEMIESYGAKVIIICNSDILGEKFLHDVLRSKLNCMEYRKAITPEIQKSVLAQMLENKIFDDAEKQRRIMEFLDGTEQGLTDVTQNEIFTNLRLLGNLLEAFTDTAALFEKETFTDGFLCSLFNSIMMSHLCYYSNSVQYLEHFVNGANLEFLVSLFFTSAKMSAPVWLSGVDDNMKWVDVSVSGYWIFNMSVPDHILAVQKEWEQYPFFELERKMLQKAESLIREKDYGLMHILFYRKQREGEYSGCWLQEENRIESALKGHDLSQIEEVQAILDMTHDAFGGRIYREFQQDLFQVLAKGCPDTRVDERTYLHEQYNRFLSGQRDWL